MSNTIEAIYEAGVFRPLTPVDNLREHERVRLIIEPTNLVEAQRQDRIEIDPKVAREIGDSADYSLLES